MHKEYFNRAELINKYIQGKLNKEEEGELQRWVDEDEQNMLLLKSLIEGGSQESKDFYSSVDLSSAWKKVSDKTIINNKKDNNRPSVFWKYAASISIVLIASVLVFYFSAKNGQGVNLKTSVLKGETIASEKKAILELEDGSRIVLEDISNGDIGKKHGARIIKNDSTLIYKRATLATSDKISLNKLSTPKGKQYQIILSDGTKVWLNAESSLQYPAVFTGNERIVELKGEAYFEVSKVKNMPFKVSANNVNVEVLGTHFNVMAYENEEMIKTTLLEGVVKVTNGKKNKIIEPGQQASVTENELVVTEVDAEEAIAWKNGFFQFNNTDLGTVIKQLERWYDVELAHNEKIEDKHFTGIISRQNNISQVLKMLEATGNVSVTIEGKDNY